MRATVLALLATCALTPVARAQDSLVRQVFRCLDTTTGLYHTCPGAAADQSVMQQLGNAVGTQVPTNIPNGMLRLDQSSKIPAAQIPFGTTSGTVGAGDAVQSNANAISSEATTARSGEKAAMDAANAAAVTANAAAPATALATEVTTARSAEKANSNAAAAAQTTASAASGAVASETTRATSAEQTNATAAAAAQTTANNAVQAAGGNASGTMVTATGAAMARSQASIAGDVVNVKSRGARGDTVILRQNVYTLGQGLSANQIVFSNGGMTSAMIGKTVVVAGAGSPGPGSHLVTTVSSVTDSTHIVLATPAAASGTYSGQLVIGYHGLPQTGVTYSFTAGSATLTASAPVFNGGHAGLGIILPGAGIAPFIGVVTSVPDGNSLLFAAAPTTKITNVGQDVPIGTDDTAAIQGAYSAAQARSTPAVYFPDGRYLVTSSLNLTGCTGCATSGTGTIYGAVSNDLPVVDMLSSRFERWSGVSIMGDAATLPIAGLAVGRISGASADNHRFRDCTIGGAYGLTALEDVGAESTPFISVQFANTVGPFTAILDGIHHWTDASAYVTQAQAADVPNSFNEAVFIADLFSGSSASGAPIWMAATGKTRFDASSYLASASPQAVILYGAASGNISMPVFDLHMEPTTLKYDFVLDGSSSPSITDMEWRDHNIQAQIAAFHIDPNAGFQTQTLNDVDFTLGVNSTVNPTLVDNPANWFMTGIVHAPASLWNLSSSITAPNTIPNWSGCYSPVYAGRTCSNETLDGTTKTKGPVIAQQGVSIAAQTPLQLGDATSGGWTTLSDDGTGRVAPYRFNAAGQYQANSLDLAGGLSVAAGQKVGLDSSGTMWVQETGGKVVIGTGSTSLFSIDASGNVRAKGTVTGSVTP